MTITLIVLGLLAAYGIYLFVFNEILHRKQQRLEEDTFKIGGSE